MKRLTAILLSVCMLLSTVVFVHADTDLPDGGGGGSLDIYESAGFGDVNCDGKIDAKDADDLRMYIAGGYDFAIDKSSSDINGDGKINVKDIITFNKYLTSGDTENSILGAIKLRGVVVENSVIDLDAAKNIKTTDDAEIVVNVTDNFSTNHKDFQSLKEYTFLVGKSDADDYIGKAVVLYVTENDDDEYEVVSIAADSTKNDTVEITLDQFVKFDSANGRIHYVETVGDDDDIYEAFEKAADGSVVLPKFVYNGKGGVAASAIFNANVVRDNGLSTNGGSITMIDNDNVKGIDVVFVEVEAIAVVDEVEDGVVIFKDSARWDAAKELFELDFGKEADDTIIALTKDGEEINYTDLKEWDVLSIIASNDSGRGYIRAEVISNKIEGTITGASRSYTSYAGIAFVINNKKYDVLEGYGTTSLEVGIAGTFYINKYGKIVAFYEKDVGEYAYIINMVGDEDIMGEKELTFMLLTADGIKQINAATRVKLNYAGDNNATCEVANLPAGMSTATQVSSSVFGGNLVKETVVKYTLNSKGEVNTITTANHDDKFEATVFTPASVEYEADKGYLGKFIDEDATIFFIDTVEVKKSVVGSVADLADGCYYNVVAIYADRNAIDNNIFVVEDSLNQIAGSAAAAIVTGVSYKIDEEGTQTFTLSYVESNEEKEATSIEDCTIAGFGLADITPGDIVKVKVNAAGNITKVDMVVDFAEGGRYDNKTSMFSEYVVDQAMGSGLEAFDCGPVTWAKEGGYVSLTAASSAYGNSYWTSGTQYIPSADLAMNYSCNLAKAETISVVEFKTDGSVAVNGGSASSFKVFESLYDGTFDRNILDTNTGEVLSTEDGTLASIEAYTDHVFCRYYDGDIVETIIIKSPFNVKIDGEIENEENEETPVEDVDYAYIINMVGDEDIMGEKELVFLLLTPDGIKQVNAATRIKLGYAGGNDATCEVANLPAGASNATQVSSSVFGGNLFKETVVKYTLNSNGEINTITTAGHDDKFIKTALVDAVVEYQADRGYLGKFIDEDATIFFIDTLNAKKSVVGTVADLADGCFYNVGAIYADNKAIDNNIVVVFDGMNQISPKANVAIITGVIYGINDDGAEVFTLSYVEGNEEKEATTIEDCDVSGFYLSDITPGDIVKVKVNSAGNITKLEMVVDFAEGGRCHAAVDKFSDYVVDWAVAYAPEEFVGGPVAWAKKGGKIEFNTDGRLEIKNGTGIVYSLDKAETISVVEFKVNGAVSVKRGSASSFKVFEDFYDGVNDKKIYDAETDTLIGAEGTDLTLIEEYTDHVFCRVYDGELIEAIIVKAPVEIRVK